MNAKTILIFTVFATLSICHGASGQEWSETDLIGKGEPSLFGDGFQLRKDAYDAFLKMKEAAAREGIQIKVVSSYRNYAHQNRIWERKYNKFTVAGMSPTSAIHKIIEYSTIPRHRPDIIGVQILIL